MPYISENGQTRFVSQAEFEAFNEANGIPGPPPRRGRSTNSTTAPAGGEVTDLSSPNNGLTGKERRALVAQQQAQVSSELTSVSVTLAQARTGKISLSPQEVAKLEARQSQLGDNFNQLENGQPVTDGSLEGGRAAQKILNPNTSNTSPDQPLPATSEKTANNSNVDPNAGFVPQSNRTGAVPTPEFETRPLAPTEDDAINQAVNEARARQQVPTSEIAQSPAGQTAQQAQQGGTPTPTPQFVPSYNFADNAPLEQAPQEQQGAVFDANGQVVGYRSRGIVETITRDAPDQPISVDPQAGARALAAPEVYVSQPDAVDDTNALGITRQYNTGISPFEPNVSNNDPLSAQTDGIGETNALGITGEARVGPFAQINPYADDERSTPPIVTNPEDVDPTRSGLPQFRESTGTYTSPDALSDAAASDYAQTENARNQQTIREQRSAFNNKDWRVRLSLAPQAQYLYKLAFTGDLLYPLRGTDGIVFPYTPQIQTSYRANYESYDLTHSNIRGYFYKNSSPQEININAQFTAQDTFEANYLLATIHFLKSCTKMFYGQDAEAGTPPPLLYLSGYGEYQFAEHPCVITNFQYNLPQDVDYIRARSVSLDGTNLVTRRDRQNNVPNTSPIYSAVSRLKTIFMPKGAQPQAKAVDTFDTSGSSIELGGENPTYVPTQMEIQITLLPIQSRSQMTKQFSVREFAQGKLLKGGFW